MKPHLLRPAEMPAIPGLRVPRDVYWILQTPAPLAGMRYPDSATPWGALAEAGVQHVVCLSADRPGYDPAPLHLLYAAALEDLYHGEPPEDPQREARLIREAVSQITSRLKEGEGVVVHCVGGTGRTGTVTGCLLRRLGFSGQEVVQYLDALHRSRGGRGWPEAPWQAEFVERFMK